LLGIWAHPDDEAFTSAGLMRAHTRRGGRVVVVTATLGERGTDDPERWPPHRLAERRHRELRRSLGSLGVHDVHVLGFEDGECASVDGTAAVGDVIERVRPERIVTFGPEGLTGHPDHRAVSRWVTRAWQRICPETSLWYATVAPEFEDLWGDVNAQLGIWYDAPERLRTPREDLVRCVTLDGADRRAKAVALRAHRSQTERMVRLLGRRAFSRWWATEAFRAASAVAAPVVAAPVVADHALAAAASAGWAGAAGSVGAA
jgi:LmbE family N-acetylglucosaminyl deacetylase